ncbi:MAG: hypothetical protein ACJ8AW_22045 [Rhodopila sp.]
MHRFLAAVALGTALLAGGGAIGTALARPAGDHAAPYAPDRPALVTPVRDGYDRYERPRYEPPPRHWHHPPPPRWHEHSWHQRHDEYRYGWR